MKAERRHDLKTNALARALDQFPQFARQHGTKVLAAIIFVGLAVMLIRHRMNSAQIESTLMRQQLTAARDQVENLGVLPFLQVPPDQLTQIRDARSGAIQKIIDQLAGASDPLIQAETLIVQGDLYWTLATFPQRAAATSQPVVVGEVNREDLLERAAKAYRQVIAVHPTQQFSVITARMGLGAIAEERGQWDEAIQQYGALIQDANVPGVYKTQAAQRTQLVNQIRHPLFMGVPATAPTTEPSDQEIIPEVPDRLPSTQPASMPG